MSRADLLFVALLDEAARRLPNTSVEKDRDKRISRIRAKRGLKKERMDREAGELKGWIGCFMRPLPLVGNFAHPPMSFAKSTKARRPTPELAKHPSSVRTPASFESTALLSQNFNSGADNLVFWRPINLHFVVGEFPKGGPWGQFNETKGNISPANLCGNIKVTFCT
ncbi:MAG: hypothetical protein ACR2H6_15470 [Pyrinomonadaceae bacterium]